VIYRSVGAENKKGRPEWFDKRVALVSLLHSASKAGDTDLTFVNDGPLPRDREDLIAAAGQVVPLAGAGNSGSYRTALRAALDSGWSEDDLVYFCEDDYIHTPTALSLLRLAADELVDAAYFSLYDHPDLYGRHARFRSTINVAGSHHWRRVPSTCMTFGARLGALRRDRWLHWVGTVPNTPRDQLIWRATLGTGAFAALPRRRSGSMISPMPSLATHAEVGQLAPGVDWPAIASAARSWAQENLAVR
jgi:hypothetical protein